MFIVISLSPLPREGVYLSFRGVRDAPIVVLAGQDIDVNVHGKSMSPLEPDSRQVDDSFGFSLCPPLGSHHFNKGLVVPDVDLGNCSSRQISLPSCPLPAGRCRLKGICAFELYSFSRVDLKGLVVLKKKKDEATRDEPT